MTYQKRVESSISSQVVPTQVETLGSLRAEGPQPWSEGGEGSALSRGKAREISGSQKEGFAHQTSLFLIIKVME